MAVSPLTDFVGATSRAIVLVTLISIGFLLAGVAIRTGGLLQISSASVKQQFGILSWRALIAVT